MRALFASTVARALVIALVVPMAFTSALPMLARLVVGRAAHVCHCDARFGHAACACPICHPERRDAYASAEAIRGVCGDDDVALGGAVDDAVPPSAEVTRVMPSPVARIVFMPRSVERVPDVSSEPEVPPPRAALV